MVPSSITFALLPPARTLPQYDYLGTSSVTPAACLYSATPTSPPPPSPPPSSPSPSLSPPLLFCALSLLFSAGCPNPTRVSLRDWTWKISGPRLALYASQCAPRRCLRSRSSRTPSSLTANPQSAAKHKHQAPTFVFRLFGLVILSHRSSPPSHLLKIK